ncbi:YafY family protein [Rhizobacter sp. Root1221]|uniref:helix-turn-helix transcriptional regulator n=1 Tax=Rhizobacter sp. Root1221 TaxID=1736433 RepID=UPI0006FBCF32|nr:YafY family protein [Rhizobacter sp. Root1221]KQV99568.1 DNA-binding protein [Rhizobacter sp. Root1221]
MSRAERLLDLMQCLRRYRHPVGGATLAAELGISLRTLYRDIASLQAQGAHIDGEPGVGYLLRPDFTLPPLMFSTTELEALTLGARWVAKRTDPELARGARDLLAKIAAVLPAELRHELDATSLLIGPGDADGSGLEHLPAWRRAMREEQKAVLRYRDAQGDVSERVVWPFALGFFDRVRVAVAWCELRQASRHFRLDRIQSFEPSGERYPRRRLALLKDWAAHEGVARQD